MSKQGTFGPLWAVTLQVWFGSVGFSNIVDVNEHRHPKLAKPALVKNNYILEEEEEEEEEEYFI